MPEMAPEAMEALSVTVRRLRPFLETDFARQLDRRFRLSVPTANAELDARHHALRVRLETWLGERTRARTTEGQKAADTRAVVRAAAISDLASRTLLRLFLLRQLEASGVSRPALLTGGWTSKAYLEFRDHAPALVEGQHADDYEGLDFLLKLLFDELAIDLPGLYGVGPLDEFFVLSPAALREVSAALNTPELETAWSDDTTLGWVYQFWNDPQREAIDERVGPRGKIAPHEIASKTQLFTERYMVDWLVENSVGRIALSMRAARLSDQTLALPGWPMFVSGAGSLAQQKLPARLDELKVLDPACGSGHFLAGVFDLLVPLYREEARDLGEHLDDAQIAERILRHNLHGIDIDGRAVQVAAAMLFYKARKLSPRGRIPPLNLVAATDVRGSLLRFEQNAQPESPFESARADDLGVRFDGPQLAAGIRLRELLVENRYDVVLFNPPYLATSKIDLPDSILSEAFGESTDLFAAFVERALSLCKPEGLIAFVALSNWMFLSTFKPTRERLLEGQILLLADVGKGAFRRASKLIQSAMVIASPTRSADAKSFAARVGSRDAIRATQTTDIADALRDAASYQPFEPGVFARVEGAPLLFWLSPAFMRRYGELPKVAEVSEGAGGIATTNNDRFLRALWEVPLEAARAAASEAGSDSYVPYVKGAEGREWIEPYRWLLRTAHHALELRVLLSTVRVERPTRLGVAYTTIGHDFSARLHTVASVRDVSGASLFAGPEATAEELVCALNRTVVRELASALNPTVNFQLNDVRRLPFDRVEHSDRIVAQLREAFAAHEAGNELSLDYRKPAPSRWESTQRWAQAAVDRAAGAPLPACEATEEQPADWMSISHALGVALRHFAGEGALPDGILFLGPGSHALHHAACTELRQAWAAQRPDSGDEELSSYLRKTFFAEHRRHYEGRPIYFPLSSAKRSFVAYVCFHGLRSTTLSNLLAEHLVTERRSLEGRLADLREARQTGGARGEMERRFADTQKLLEELNDFIAKVTELAEKGPPPADAKTRAREIDARYEVDHDDGVMITAAGLWPLLEPQWKEPKKLWKELANANGTKEYDGAHLAARVCQVEAQPDREIGAIEASRLGSTERRPRSRPNCSTPEIEA